MPCYVLELSILCSTVIPQPYTSSSFKNQDTTTTISNSLKYNEVNINIFECSLPLIIIIVIRLPVSVTFLDCHLVHCVHAEWLALLLKINLDVDVYFYAAFLQAIDFY